MIALRIEHKIADYSSWKKAFDSDPINRKQSGVKRFRIYQPTDDPNFVIIELEFNHLDQALSTQKALQDIFPKIEGSLVFKAQTKIIKIVESQEL